jgi:glycosyltransferase involved in cell wall biosynthesis
MRPIRMVEFTKAFHIGGTEVQVVELLRGLPGDYELAVAVLDEVGPLVEKVRGLGHVPRSFPLGGTFMSHRSVLQIARMAAWLKQSRVQLVHVHDFYATLIGVPAAKLAGAKVVVGRLDLLHWHGKVRSAVIAEITRWADHVVVNAEAVRAHVLGEGIPAERITLIRNGIDLPLFDRRAAGELEKPLPHTGEAPVAVQVANMSHSVKRQEDMLDAMALCPVRFHTLFVGDGERKPELIARAHRLGLEHRAHFLGTRQDAPAIMSRATFGVLTSELEGLSNAVIEGMAARLPMLVTRAGGNPELIADGVRGRVVETRRPDQIAEAAKWLLTHPTEARQRGRAGRAMVEEELTLDRMVAAHDRLYRQVVRSPEVALELERGAGVAF